MKKSLSRLLAVLLSLVMLSVSALALTPEQTAQLLEEYYIDDVPQAVLEAPTVDAMLEALGDPYTQYFDAETYQAFMAAMEDASLVGVGVTMQLDDKGALITKVLAGSPAGEADLRAGDIVIAVDGTRTAGLSLDEIGMLLRGEAGTRVRVTILRGGNHFDRSMTRAELTIPATTTELIDGHIGYIECNAFGSETVEHFQEGVETYGDRADYWIVDLRGNGGGDVEAAVKAAAVFAGGGDLAYLQDHTGTYYVHQVTEPALTGRPVIVLVDGGTASASEIFASIIRDTDAGVVVGSRTYGKGVAQVLLDGETDPDCFTEGDALKVTSYRYYSFLGAATDKVGVLPDLLVPDQYAADVAYLLATSRPGVDSPDMVRLDLGWRLYIDLQTALSDEYREAFTALLEAIPPAASLRVGSGMAENWLRTSAAELADWYNLEDYTPRTFSDLGDSPMAVQINTLYTYGLVSGAGDGTFRPEETLTRAQFCSLLAQAMRYKAPQGAGAFPDVDGGAWYADAVNALHAAGVVDGYSDGLFHPDDPMDHQQFITIMARVALKLSMGFAQEAAQNHDVELTAPALAPWPGWARDGVWLLTESQISFLGTVSFLWDDLENIAPGAPTTREEAALTLYAVMVYSGILNSD